MSANWSVDCIDIFGLNSAHTYSAIKLLILKKSLDNPLLAYPALGTQRNLERHKIADLKHSRSAKIRRHLTMFRAAFAIVRAVLGHQNNAFTPEFKF